MSRRVIGKQGQRLFLNAILHVTPGTVQVLVQGAGVPRLRTQGGGISYTSNPINSTEKAP